MLRRAKNVVAKDLPPKTIIDIICPLSSIQTSMYEEIVHAAAFKIDTAEEQQAVFQASSAMDCDTENDAQQHMAIYNVASNCGKARSLLAVGRKAAAIQPLLALGSLGLICVHPALVISDDHKQYRQSLLSDLRSSGKMLQLLRLFWDLELVEPDELKLPGTMQTAVEFFDYLVESTEDMAVGDSKSPAFHSKQSRVAVEQSDSDQDEPTQKSKKKGATDNTKRPSSVGGSARKCLIFAQHRCTLDLLEREVFQRFFPLVRRATLDGSVKPDQRFDVVKEFNRSISSDKPISAGVDNDTIYERLKGALPTVHTCQDEQPPSIRFLLLTTRACSLGLNLTAADTVIFMEHDWNPFVDMQAMDRVHRIGQANPVTIYRLLADSTVESRVMGLQRFKQQLSHEVRTTICNSFCLFISLMRILAFER